MLQVALVGQPDFNLNALLLVATEAWGISLATGIDQRHPTQTSLERFMICLTSFQKGAVQAGIAPQLLSLVHLSWLLVGDEDELHTALNYLPTANRLLPPPLKRGLLMAFVQTTLEDCRQLLHGPSATESKSLADGIQVQLDNHNLLRLFKIATPHQAASNTQRLLR